MKILMCCATPKELKTVKTEIKNLNLKTQLPIEYLCTGIGNHLTIFRLTRYLEVHQREKFFVVNVGVCGYSSKILPYIQCVMVEHIQIQKEHIIPIFLKFAPLKKLVSSDVVVDDEGMLQRWQDEEIYVDMESYGIELVAQLFQYPRLILKVPVDKVGVETKDFDIEEALEKLKKNVDYQKLIKGVLEYISQIKE